MTEWKYFGQINEDPQLRLRQARLVAQAEGSITSFPHGVR